MVTRMLADDAFVMGFGHRVYKNGDPRNLLMKTLAQRLSEADRLRVPKADPNLFTISNFVEQLMLQKVNVHANADFYAASTFHQCGIPSSFFTPVFSIARTSGWAAHVMEQRAAKRLIRPTSVYVGPAVKKFVAVTMRR